MEIQKPIKMSFRLIGGTGGVIPYGVVETLTIHVRDGIANFHFNDGKTTQRFIIQTRKLTGSKTEYLERIQVGIIHYPNMKKKEIAEKILKDLEELRHKK